MGQIIKCPKCKKEQPKQPVCAHCGFDIRAYALSRQKKNSQPQDITCPGCNGKVPKQPLCPLCGFDIRDYALSHKGQKSPAPGVTCPNCHEQTPQEATCKYCGYDIRMVGYSEQYHAHDSYKPEMFSESVPSGPEPPISPKELFTRSLQSFRQRWGALTILSLLSFLFMLFGFILPVYAGITLHSRFYQFSNLILASGVLLSPVLGMLGLCWGLSSLTASIMYPGNSLVGSLRAGIRNIISYVWMAVLASMVIVGGFSLFSLPGVLFMVWAFAAQFIIFKQHERGMDALLKSSFYVRGHWLNTFVKLIFIFLAGALVSLVPLGALIFMPFMLIYLHEMFEDLLRIKIDENPPEKNTRAKFGWSAAGLLGFVLPLLIISMLAGPVLMDIHEQLRSGDIMLEQYIPIWMR